MQEKSDKSHFGGAGMTREERQLALVVLAAIFRRTEKPTGELLPEDVLDELEKESLEIHRFHETVSREELPNCRPPQVQGPEG
ncbi:hypothetical protein [Roseinatronobacter sp.]|uniref:hypothetical protein n=1 Tax=Roseinatronobacter sp. TaxID=1945755 RepID=UPI0025D7988C|nr:hypothetical protein [Roseibaca sp.]